MKNHLVSCFLLAASLGVVLCQHTNFEWKDCGGPDALVRFHQIDFSPMPIVVSKTSTLSLTSNVSIEQDLPNGVFIELVINKTFVIGGEPVVLTIPCVDGLGSCAIELCDLWNLWYGDIICPFFKNAGHQCGCPIQKGEFVSKDVKIDVPFAQFKGRIAEFATGDYSINFSIYDPSVKKQHGCLNIKAYLTIDHE